MKILKTTFWLAVVVAAALAAYLFAPLILSTHSAKSASREALRWVEDSYRGSALQRRVRNQLERVGLPGPIEELEVRNDHGVAHLRLRYDHVIELGGRELLRIPFEIELEQKLLHQRGF